MNKIILLLIFVTLGSNLTFSQDWNEIIKNVASDGTAFDNFGRSVSISGDYAIVGALYEDEDENEVNTLSNAGSAYIFKTADGGATWTEVQKVVAGDRGADDYFGYSVSISGNYAIVGASQEDEDASGGNTLNSAGSAYIFKTTDGGATWTEAQKVVAGDRGAGDYFGGSVSISGNYAIVGAASEDEDASEGNTLNGAGSAYIFRTADGGETWAQVQKIVASNRGTQYSFGRSVSISGNYAIVGAPNEIDSGNWYGRTGAAHIFKTVDSGATWAEVQNIAASDRDENDTFGGSVSISGDYAIIGAPYEEEDENEVNTLSKAGSAYIFKTADGGATWTEVQKVVAGDRGADDYFGNSVSISGDYAIIGSPWEDEDASGGNTLSSAGSAYLFNTADGGATWTEVQKIVASDRAGGDLLGYSVSLSGNYTIIGAVDDDGSTGSSYIFGFQASLTVTSPNGIENWEEGSTNAITWTSAGFGGVDIAYSTDNGNNWTTIFTNTTDDGTEDWTVPNTLSATALIKITENGGTATDESDATFTIAGVTAVTSPNGSENWDEGSAHDITWTETGSVTEVDISYYNGTSWVAIVTNHSGGSPYSWTVPNALTEAAKIKVVNSNGASTDASNVVFTISGVVAVTSPNGSENWEEGSSHDIIWTETGSVNNVDISYFNGTSWVAIVTNHSGDSPYNWTVPNALTEAAKIKVKTSSGVTEDLSNVTFTIAGVTAVTSPNGTETWETGSSKSITWTKVGAVAATKIEYSADNGSNWTTLTTTATGTTYTWNPVNNTPSATAKVRVSNNAGSSTDMSNATFTIVGINAVTSPNGGELLSQGGTHNITWSTHGTVALVDIDYSTNGGTDWISVATNQSGTSYSWSTIPSTPTVTAKVRVSSVSGTSTDLSDANFTIRLNTPSLTSPIDAAITQALNPTFNWSSIASATHYRLEIYTDPNDVAGSSVYDDGTLTTNSQQVSGVIENNRKYYWRVTATNLNGNSSLLSSEFSFTTLLATAVNTTPGSGSSSGYTTPVTFNWTHSGNSSNVDFVVTAGTDALVTENLVTNTVNGLLTATLALPNGGTYYWKVQSTVDDGTADNDTETNTSTITSFTQTLTTPTLSLPLDAAANQALDVTLSWAGLISGANNYRLEVNTSDTFGDGTSVYDNNVGIVTSIAPGNLEDATTYYWRVSAVNTVTSESSAATAYRSFSTVQQSVVGVTPVTGATLVGVDPTTISWPSTLGADRYRLVVSTNNLFTEVVYDNSAITTTSKDVLGLLNNTLYYWRVTAISNRVTAISDTNRTSSSSSSSFTTTLATPVQATPANSSSQIYGVPVTFTWSQSGSYSAVNFKVTVATDNGITQNVQTSTVSNVLTTSITLPQAGIYYWNIYAIATGGANAGENKTSATTTFTLTLPGPALTAPVNGLTGISVEPVFTWGSVLGAVSYKIYLDDANDFATPLYALDQGTNLTKSFFEIETQMINGGSIPLNNNTMYYWKVAAVDNSGNEFDSQINHFKTFPNVDPALTWPSSGTVVYTTATQFGWTINGAIGTLQFELQLAQQAVQPTATEWSSASSFDNITDLFYTTNLNGGLDYWWRIIVKNATGEIEDYSAETHFTTAGGATVNPIPSWPTGNATVYTNTPTCYWYTTTGATGVTYQVRYATTNSVDGVTGELNTGGAASLPIDGNIGTATSDLFKTLPLLTAGTHFYWQVRSYYAASGDYGTWSALHDFTTNGSGTLVVPTASYPTAGVTVYTTAPYLYWYLSASSSGLVYDIELNTNNTFTGTPTVGVATNDVNALYTQLSGLTPGLTYYWKVRSDNNTTESGWSATESFVVAGGSGASYPVATYPISNPTIYTNTPQLNWYLEGSSLGFVKYTVKYSTTDQVTSGNWNTFTPATANDGTDGTFDITPVGTTYWTVNVALDYNETYYWAVTFNDGNNSTWSMGSFTTVGGSSSIPINSFPTDGFTVYGIDQTLSWYVNGSSTGIVSYDITYSISDMFAGGSPTTRTVNSTTQSKALTGLTPGATYYWKVKSKYASSETNYSSITTFTVDPGANSVVPMPGSPSNNVAISTSSPTFAWILPAQSESELTFSLEYSTSDDFSDSEVIDGLSMPFTQVGGLEAQKEYYWRVKSTSTNGDVSGYSPIGMFSTDGITGVEDEKIIPMEFSVDQNYPNPFNPSTEISYSLPEGSFVSIKIYDLLGQEIKILINQEISAGSHKVSWYGDDSFGNSVTTGIYLYRVVTGKDVVVKKMILMK